MVQRTKPSAPRRSDGSHRADRHKAEDAAFPEGIPTMPEWLDRQAAAEWRHLVGILEPLGVLSPGDEMSLATLCALYSEFQQDPTGMSAGKVSQMRQLFAEFGLTPATRSRPVPAPKPKPADPWDEL